MKNDKKMKLALSLLAAGTLLYGCGTKKVMDSEVPSQPSGSETAVQKTKLHHYTVKKHDTLWAIASKSSLYGDPFEWPALYKQNRDKITDPDLIYPAQVFQYEKVLPTADMQEDKKLAEETPKYTPHDKPRQKLPLDYF
jgi:LysM domain